MNDPKRLLEEAPTELERSLLNAVAAEQPSPEHRMQVREAMGLGPAAAPASLVPAAPSGMGKLVVVGGIVGAGAIAALLLLGRSPKPAPTTSTLPSPAVTVAPPPVEPTAFGTAQEPAAEAPPPVEAVDPAPRATRRSTPLVSGPAEPPSAHRPSVAPSGGSDIREQIRLIDEARAAVAAHEAGAAIRALDQYRSKFPSGALDQEATVLRIEALDQRGDHAQAASMARAFLARNPASAHAKRLERIAGQ